MKCLIIAAGRGSRLQQFGDSKPLIPILGVPLIERVIRLAMEAGADDFYVVIGYQAVRVRAFLEDLVDRLGVRIHPIVNEDWEKENGLSVLRARPFFDGPFLLLMSDHLFDPAMARELLAFPLQDGEIALCTDGDTTNTLVDMEDVTKVQTHDGKICRIGKELSEFNGFDTGLFLCTPAFFDALARSAEQTGNTSLTGAVRILAAEGRAKAVQTERRFWIDVDDPAAYRRAETALLANLRGKPGDGPVSRYCNRPLSVAISRRLVNFRITPNQISLFSFICSMVAGGLFALGGYAGLLAGGILAQFASIIDGCDGEVARLKYLRSHFGGWFDAVLDRYADAFLLFGLVWHVYTEKPESLVLVIGFMAIIGSFMLSYTADKYDNIMRDRISFGRQFRLGRDVRIFVIFLGAAFNMAYLTLAVIAVVMNLETVRRVLICRDYGNIDDAKRRIRSILAGSKVPEDFHHAENTLEWLFRLDPTIDQSMQIAALAHDIDRAVETQKVRRADYDDYDVFKAAHADNGAKILRKVLDKCGVDSHVRDEACRLVMLHEVGGDPRADLLKDADSISYFKVNLPSYYQREGWDETTNRCIWGYQRLSARVKNIVDDITYEDGELTRLLREAIQEA